MAQDQIALVLGATGGIGGEVTRGLLARGWTVRALHRNAAQRAGTDGISWIQGDAMVRDDVLAAAKGAALIVHAVNPPGYRNWGSLVLPMLDNSIAAAAANSARILVPGNIYNFGPDVFPLVPDGAPQHPVSAKGAIRVEMESRLRAAAAHGVRSLVVRAGDYFGPRAVDSSMFAQVLIKPGQVVRSITYPGTPGAGHQWAYLPDVAATMLRLIEREDRLEDFAVFQMEGQWDADGTGMIAAIKHATGNPRIAVKALPWALIRLASPLVPLFREMNEMRYLWQQPIRISNARLLEILGTEPHTPLDQAVRETLVGLGCLPAEAPYLSSVHAMD